VLYIIPPASWIAQWCRANQAPRPAETFLVSFFGRTKKESRRQYLEHISWNKVHGRSAGTRVLFSHHSEGQKQWLVNRKSYCTASDITDRGGILISIPT
jgi:hypothetical protein